MVDRGVWLSGPDNDSYMLADGDSPDRCPECGFVKEHAWVNPQFRLRKKALDLSITYDGYYIASERFCRFASQHGARCEPLPSEPGYFVLRIDNVVTYDSAKRGTRFSDQCARCGRYAEVTGATPVYVADPGPLPETLSRTDLEFGSFDGKASLLLAGPRLSVLLREERFMGVNLTPVRSENS